MKLPELRVPPARLRWHPRHHLMCRAFEPDDGGGGRRPCRAYHDEHPVGIDDIPTNPGHESTAGAVHTAGELPAGSSPGSG